LSKLFLHNCSNAAYLSIFEKWFIFAAVGLRLLSAGFKQLSNPEFTLREIFNITDSKSAILVKELGIHNMCIGFFGLLTPTFPSLKVGVVLIAGLYFGTAGLLHVFNNPLQNQNKMIAMISDLYALVILFFLAFFRSS
jgi:hypothetical protein